MALVEEKLPGVSKVRGEFQVREDSALAERLQEEEFEGHYNANVQLRRTARHDVSIAKNLQKEEILDYRQQESRRRDELRRREEEDKAHAEEVAKKLQEEEEIQAAMRMQDELVAKKLHQKEQKQIEQRRRQEFEDARLAKQSSMQEEQSLREQRRKEIELSEREIQRMQRGAGRPSQRYSVSPSPPPPPYPDEEEEPVMDENERIALQEAEDERLAREMEEEERRKTEAAKQRRQQEDIELAKRLQRQESGGRDLEEDDLERMKREKEDMLLAKKLQKMELEEQKRKRREAEMRRHAEVPDGEQDDDLELAKKLQKEEIEAQRRRRREAEMRRIQQQQQQQPQPQLQPQGWDPSVTQSLHQPPRTGRAPHNRSPERNVSPSHRVSDPTQSLPANIHHNSSELGRPPPQGHPFNPVSSYRPAQAGVSVTAASTRQRPPQESAQPPGLMSYKRQTDTKGKKSRYSSQV